MQVEATKMIGLPLIVTEQYPKGLGNTVSELEVQHAVGVFPKTKFSMVVPQVESALANLCEGHLKCAVLFGVEVIRMKYLLIKNLSNLILLFSVGACVC